MKYSSYSKVQFLPLSWSWTQWQRAIIPHKTVYLLLLSLQLSFQFQPLDNSAQKSHWFIPFDKIKYCETRCIEFLKTEVECVNIATCNLKHIIQTWQIVWSELQDKLKYQRWVLWYLFIFLSEALTGCLNLYVLRVTKWEWMFNLDSTEVTYWGDLNWQAIPLQ